MKITKVIGGEDGTNSLWRGEELIVQGDYYHDKINDYIDGFLDGLKWCDITYDFEEIEAELHEDRQDDRVDEGESLSNYLARMKEDENGRNNCNLYRINYTNVYSNKNDVWT